MIQYKKTRRDIKRKQAKQVRDMAQMTVNAVLWQIIRQNAEANDEDFDMTKSAMLTVPMEDFKSVPQGFKLKVEQDKDGNMLIMASGVETKSDLILPKSEIII